MRTHSAKSIPTFIRRAVLQAIAVFVVVAILLTFVYGFAHYYQQKRLHIQQLAELLANSASTADGANLVARQVSVLLEDDVSIQSILFYSTDHPVVTLGQVTIDQTTSDWYNALFTSTVSFNRAVTSHNMTGSGVQATTSKQLAMTLSSSTIETNAINNNISDSNILVGYINITLDINKLRWEWLRKNILLWLATLIVGISSCWIILRKLNWPTKDIAELVKVCNIIIDNPELKQLPVIQQRFDFQELSDIRLTFVTLFNRLRIAQQKNQALAAFEQHLHNKDVSLEVQRYNFQSMITHELKTSLNAISGGLQLLNMQTLDDEQKDILAIIHKGSQHLDTTLAQIIQLNKIEKGQISLNLSDFNPLQLLSDLFAEFEPIAKQKGLTFISRIHHIDYTLEGDVNKIKQILSTLIENAIKFTASGQVVIESQLTHFNESIRWQIKVIDTGIGIDAKYMDDIFTPFFQVDPSYTREYEGVGVGLPVVKQIAQLIDATIEVNSEFGFGSEFTVLISLHDSYQNQRQYSLAELNIVYYHHAETGFMVEALQRFGASINCQQHELSVIEQLISNTVSMVMIAEDILPKEAAQIARHIREQESTHRVLLVYWYPAHEAQSLDSFEYGLKAAGIDFCHVTTRDSKVLYQLLKKWLA